MDICQDLQDGHLDGTYTQAQLNAFFSDPTVQGYCGPITVIVAPPAPPVTPAPTSPPPTAPTAPPAVAIAPAVGPVTPPVQVGITEVAGTQKTISQPVKVAAVKGTQHTVRVPTTRAATAPISTTRSRGTLPFTGAQLTLFLLVGLGLVATGFVLRATGRRRPQE